MTFALVFSWPRFAIAGHDEGFADDVSVRQTFEEASAVLELCGQCVLKVQMSR